MRPFTLFIASILLNLQTASSFVVPNHFAVSVIKATGPSVPRLLPVQAATASNESLSDESLASTNLNARSVAGSLWGMLPWVYILVQALKHTLPSALEPIKAGRAFFSPFQWCAYFAAVVIFAYGQGNRCLQLKLSPLVVKRSFTNLRGLNFLFAPLYTMGLITATKQRLIKSYSLIGGTASLQVALQRGMLVKNGPLLCILNAGFAAGFSWGVISLIWQYISFLMTRQPPSVDAGLPSSTV